MMYATQSILIGLSARNGKAYKARYFTYFDDNDDDGISLMSYRFRH